MFATAAEKPMSRRGEGLRDRGGWPTLAYAGVWGVCIDMGVGIIRAAELGRVELTFVSDIVLPGTPPGPRPDPYPCIPEPLPRPMVLLAPGPPTPASRALPDKLGLVLSCCCWGCKDSMLFKALLTDLFIEVRNDPKRPKPG